MSLVSPASSKPCAANACIGPLASCRALGRSAVGEPARERVRVGLGQRGRVEVGAVAVRCGDRDPAQRPGAAAPGAADREPGAGRLGGPGSPASPAGPATACPPRRVRRRRGRRSTRPPRPGRAASPRRRSRRPARPPPSRPPRRRRCRRAASRRGARGARGTAGCRTAGGSAPGPRRAGSARPGPAPMSASGTSRTSAVICRLRSTSPRCSRSASPALPLTSSTRLTRSSSEPNSLTHLVAVFSPTPGMPGRLSLGSPRMAAKSGYCWGVSPYFSSTAAGVKRDMSVMPRRVIRTVTWSSTSCSTSRSPVTISTSMPSFSARVASVAITSSASNPAALSRAMPSASSTSKIRLSWLRKSSGRLPPVRLVLDVLLVPERRLAAVERHRDVRGLLVAQHVDEHGREAVHGVGRLPRGGGEVLRRQREKRPVGQRVPVEQQQPAPGRGRGLSPGFLAARRGRSLRRHGQILWSRGPPADAMTPVPVGKKRGPAARAAGPRDDGWPGFRPGTSL